MSRIGITVGAFEQYLLTQMSRANNIEAASALRLSTGLRIVSPKDNPSDFLNLQGFESRLSEIHHLQANVETAANLGAEVQTSLAEVRGQLDSIRELLITDESAGLTVGERADAQGQVDAAIEAIRTISRTKINGQSILDGSGNYTITKNLAQVKELRVLKGNLAATATVSGTVTAAATRASVAYTGAAGTINSGNATFSLTGKRGASTFSVTNGETLTGVRDRINAASHNTGITASVAGNVLTFTTVDYGTSATINVNTTSSTFTTVGTTAGTNAAVTVGASSWQSTDGNVVWLGDAVGDNTYSVELQAGYVGAFSATVNPVSTKNYSISSRIDDRLKLAIPGVAPELFGGLSGRLTDLVSGQSLAGLGTNTSAAIRVIDEALAQLTGLEGQVDAFADVVVESAGRLLDQFESDTEEPLDALGAVDEEAENQVLSKAQILRSSALSSLAIMTQQRVGMLGVLQLLAGA